MGQGKTGTTALQLALHHAADRLRACKVLYPRFGGTAFAHHLLLALSGNAENLPPWTLLDNGGPQAIVKKAMAAWAATCDDLQRDPPDLLVLSSEFLVRQADANAKARLAGILSALSSDITPILYVRHPVEHFRSRLQEWLKARSEPLPPTRLPLRESILDTEAAFSRPPSLVAFDRSTLVGGDIVADFTNRFLMPWVDPADLRPRQANPGLSAEALVLMTRLRSEGGNTTETARKVARLVKHLLELDRADPPAQPFALYPEVAEAALRAATCYRWLAESGRLHIPDLDVSRIDGAPVPDWMITAPPETLFPHDPDRLDRLRRSVEQLPPKALSEPRKASTKRSEVKAKPRMRDLLLRFLLRKLASIQDRKTGTASARIKTVQNSYQGERNEDYSTDGHLNAGPRHRP